MITHGFVPEVLLQATVISIPKDNRASLCNSENYRGIALCNALCKLFDLIVLSKFERCFCTTDLQFGFKRGLSTTLCTAVLRETVNYYVQRNSNVYVCLLDASKAFDRVQFGKLFKLLLSRDVPHAILRILLHWYTHHSVKASWSNAISDSFSTLNGVKQGGVLSPILFTVYFDELFVRLKESDVGCRFGQHYAGVLGYADDISLVAPNLRALYQMLAICTEYASEYSMTFNPKKSLCMKFGSERNEHDRVLLNGQEIDFVKSARHLGNMINTELSDSDDCSYKLSSFHGYVNKLLGLYGGFCGPVIHKLFSSFCCSFYGSPLWSFSSVNFKKVCIQWNKAVRRVLRLPNTTHTWLLGPFLNQYHLSVQLKFRFLKFFSSMYSCTNELVSTLHHLALFSSRTFLGSNIASLRNEFNVNFDDPISCAFTNIREAVYNELAIYDIDPICELYQLTWNPNLLLDGFSENEIYEMLIYFCVE